MSIPTLLEFATDKMLTLLLVKERAKCRRRNSSEKHHTLDKECDIDNLTTRKKLSRLMPPRYTWVRPSKSKRVKLPNENNDTTKNAEKALILTIKRDEKLREGGTTFEYLDELHAFFDRIRKLLSAKSLTFEQPTLFPILKDIEHQDNGTKIVTCRPISAYSRLEDKIILALTSHYLTRYFDRYLHKNILSYRNARDFGNKKHHVTNFNDGIRLIKDFHKNHQSETIYAADCDIRNFYDIFPHRVVRECFERFLNKSQLSDDGKAQVMKVVNAYLASYNFYENAWLKTQPDYPAYRTVFSKVCRRLHDDNHKNIYQFGWPQELGSPQSQSDTIGVAQGGSLSLLVANIVLNDVDQKIVESEDPNRLFIRYCDDMILLHTDFNECCRLMEQYAESLQSHGLHYHPFRNVSECGRKEFWHIKSHLPFLWADGDGNCNRYIGFLGYELRRDGRMRLRKSNIVRFKEKILRISYAIHRYSRDHTREETLAYQEKVLNGALNGIKFYKAFNEQQFRRGKQYRYLVKLKEKFTKM